MKRIKFINKIKTDANSFRKTEVNSFRKTDANYFRKTAPSFMPSPRSPLTSYRSFLLQNDIKNIMEKASPRLEKASPREVEKVIRYDYSTFDKMRDDGDKLSKGISAFIDSEREYA